VSSFVFSFTTEKRGEFTAEEPPTRILLLLEAVNAAQAHDSSWINIAAHKKSNGLIVLVDNGDTDGRPFDREEDGMFATANFFQESQFKKP
jgi:hypothetical protein